mmetsp:Transcript_19859/g.55395  ORF Transcript_19859/g.55395 Transcript_19859/m.55395 type:complete len:204 (+) Transcript_19859:657-1268(+)
MQGLRHRRWPSTCQKSHIRAPVTLGPQQWRWHAWQPIMVTSRWLWTVRAAPFSWCTPPPWTLSMQQQQQQQQKQYHAMPPKHSQSTAIPRIFKKHSHKAQLHSGSPGVRLRRCSFFPNFKFRGGVHTGFQATQWPNPMSLLQNRSFQFNKDYACNASTQHLKTHIAPPLLLKPSPSASSHRCCSNQATAHQLARGCCCYCYCC